MLASGPVLLAVKILSVFLFVVALLAGFVGLPDYSRNAAPTIFWVIGWVGLAFASVLLGNIWLLVNPWLILFDWADALWRRLTSRGLSFELAYPRRLGVLPGILMIVGFTWFMLASGLAGDSRSLACAVAVYSAVTWIGMLAFGAPAWLAHGEAFTLLFGVLARFSPTALRVADREICRRADCPPGEDGGCTDCPEAFLLAPPEKRAITLRGYGVGLIVQHPLSLSMVIVVLMVLALVAFEGFMDTAQWIDLMTSLGELEESGGIHAPVKTTLSFLVATAILFGLFFVTSALMRMIGYAGAAPKRSTLRDHGPVRALPRPDLGRLPRRALPLLVLHPDPIRGAGGVRSFRLRLGPVRRTQFRARPRRHSAQGDLAYRDRRDRCRACDCGLCRAPRGA